MIRKLTFFGLMIAIVTVLAACGGDKTDGNTSETPNAGEGQLESPVSNDEVVANVNGESISGSMYNNVYQQVQIQMMQSGQDLSDERVIEILKEETLDIIIGNRLLLQDAKKKGYTAEEDQVKEELSAITGQFESEAELNEALKASELTLEELTQQLREDMTIQAYMSEEIQVEVTDEEVEDFYNQFVGSGSEDEEMPSLADLTPQIKQIIQSQKVNDQLLAKVDELKSSSQIEILI